MKTNVVVILTREQSLSSEVCRVHVSSGRIVRIPTTEANVESSDRCDAKVDDDDLFVMRPFRDARLRPSASPTDVGGGE